MNEQKKPLSTDTVTLNKVTFSHQDIFNVGDHFYGQLMQQNSSSEVSISAHDKTEHVDRLTQFWWVRFGGKPYLFSDYNPVAKHFFAGFNQQVLTNWLEIFHHALKDHLTDSQAHVWSNIAIKMGQMLMAKNEFFRVTENEETGN